MGAEVLAHGLAYADAGLPVLPVHTPVGLPTAPPCPCRRQDCGHPCSCMDRGCPHPGKHPRTTNGAKDATTDPTVITRWCTTWSGTNLGVVPPPGVVVVDVDRHSGGPTALAALITQHGHLVPTWTAHTGGGGLHAWFRSAGPFRGKLCRGVDLKSDTGYVIVEPSLHASGRRYAWANELPIATAPVWLAEMMLKREPLLRSTINAGMFSGTSDDALVRFVAASESGERNDRLYWAGRRAAEHGGSDEVFACLHSAAVGAGLTAHEATLTLSSARTGAVAA